MSDSMFLQPSGGGGTVKTVDTNGPDANGNAASAGPKTGAQVSALLANATTAERAGLVTALKGDGLLNGLLKDA